LDDARLDEAAGHFTAADNADAPSSEFIQQTYEDFTVVRQDVIACIMLSINTCFVQLFGWDFEALILTVHQKWCQAFLSIGEPDKALEEHKHLMDTIDESAKASCLVWSNGKSSVRDVMQTTVLTHVHSAFKQECRALCAANGDAALAARDYDTAIELYSAAITLNSASSTFFANRSKAKLGKMLWMEALLDAQKVR
jgi:hypothetical protein